MQPPWYSASTVCLQENYLQSGKRKRLSGRHSTDAAAEEGPMELPDPERELAMRSVTEPCQCLQKSGGTTLVPWTLLLRPGCSAKLLPRSKSS